MRALIALLLLVFLGTHAPPRATPPVPPPEVALFTFEPVPAGTGDKEDGRKGALLYLAGWSIESNDHRFGGLSAMHVEEGEVLAFSDAGWRIRFPLPHGSRTVPGEIAALRGGPGSEHAKADRDVESMAVHGPLVWLALERRNLILRYDRHAWRGTGTQPPAMRRWRANRGAEAMLRLPDGRFMIFSEGSGGLSDVLLFEGDPAVQGTRAVRMRYRPPKGFRITDAAMLPDGRILFLNRRMNLIQGAAAKLTAGPVPFARHGGLVEGEEIADLSRPTTVDNMEALSITREADRTIVWIASDDNYLPLQRTLLLKFALVE
jgi:hypothetical protein